MRRTITIVVLVALAVVLTLGYRTWQDQQDDAETDRIADELIDQLCPEHDPC